MLILFSWQHLSAYHFNCLWHNKRHSWKLKLIDFESKILSTETIPSIIASFSKIVSPVTRAADASSKGKCNEPNVFKAFWQRSKHLTLLFQLSAKEKNIKGIPKQARHKQRSDSQWWLNETFTNSSLRIAILERRKRSPNFRLSPKHCFPRRREQKRKSQSVSFCSRDGRSFELLSGRVTNKIRKFHLQPFELE